MTILKNKALKRAGIIGLAVVVLFGGVYWFLSKDTPEDSVVSALALHEVAKGAVTNGIRASGKIEAAEVLDLNVYKLNARIDELAVTNGTYVEKGSLLLAFDESEARVAIAESELAIREAQLALQNSHADTQDPNIAIASLQNDIAVLERNLEEYAEDKREALRDYLNADSTAEPSAKRYEQQIIKTAPTIGGLYKDTEQGEYRLRVYASGAPSGYSYELTGLESGVFNLYFNSSVPLGTRGLTITFPATSVDPRDEWIVAVPNTYASNYIKNKETYNKAIAKLDESKQTDSTTLANKRIQLEQEQRTDTLASRTLDVESSSLAIDKARVTMEKNVNTRLERRVIAPFSGTVEGMKNVVLGATPSRESTDSVDLGKLISKDFLVTFSLSANDVDKVTQGDKVVVTLTTVPGSKPLEATITEISSLPDSSTIAQYAVSARIDTALIGGVRLRDGMLADVEIVQEERTGVVRIPVSALSYSEGKAQVTVLEEFSEIQEQQFARMGIIRSDTALLKRYPRTVTVGLRGTYYVEIVDGLQEGERVLTSASTNSTPDAGAVVRTGFGAGMGGGRPPEGSH